MGNDIPKSSVETRLELYIWKAFGPNIGHIALYIPDNNLYISFWPAESVNGGMIDSLESVRSTTHSYDQDVQNYTVIYRNFTKKIEPEVTKAVFKMDISAMEEAWKEIQKKKYSLAFFNCADAVGKVLEAGNTYLKALNIFNRWQGDPFAFDPDMDPVIVEPTEERDWLEKIFNFKRKSLFSAITKYTTKRI